MENLQGCGQEAKFWVFKQQQSSPWPTSGTPAPQHPGCTLRAEAEGDGRQKEARAGMGLGLELHWAGSLA